MVTASFEPTVPGKADRAFEAFEHAALRAEGKTVPAVNPATHADVVAALAADRFRVRMSVDRVLVADGAEEGLDDLADRVRRAARYV